MYCLRRTNRFFLLALFIAICNCTYAQLSDEAPEKVRYFNQFLTGPVIGEKLFNASFHASTFHGISYKRFSLAPGFSLDTYDSWKVLHYAATANWEVARGVKGSVITAVTGGIDATVKNPDQQLTGWNYTNKSASMLQAAAGYRFNIKAGHLYVLAGYRLQKLEYSQTPRWYFGDMWGGETTINHVKQEMRRVVLQLGFGF